jgi:hypothetical protein
MTRLWITGVTPTKKVAAVRAMRKAAMAAGHGEGTRLTSVATATMYFRKLASGEHEPLLVATEDNPEIMAALTAALDEGGIKYEITYGDESATAPAEAADPATEAEDDANEVTLEDVYRVGATATILMSAGDGRVIDAYMLAKRLLDVTEDPLYENVIALLMHTFPPQNLPEADDDA